MKMKSLMIWQWWYGCGGCDSSNVYWWHQMPLSWRFICLLVHVFIIMICWRWQWWFRCSWIYWWWWWYDEETVIVSRCWLVTLNASQPENYSSVHFPMGSPTTHCNVLHSLYSSFFYCFLYNLFIHVCFPFSLFIYSLNFWSLNFLRIVLSLIVTDFAVNALQCVFKNFIFTHSIDIQIYTNHSSWVIEYPQQNVFVFYNCVMYWKIYNLLYKCFLYCNVLFVLYHLAMIFALDLVQDQSEAADL